MAGSQAISGHLSARGTRNFTLERMAGIRATSPKSPSNFVEEAYDAFNRRKVLVKGASKSRRKASPGSRSEDMTSEQATSVGQITAPIAVSFLEVTCVYS